MSVIEHLEELRFRIIASIAAVLLGAIVAYVFYEPILDFLLGPIDSAGRIGEVKVENVYVSGIATGFLLRIKVSAFAGVVFGLPVVLFQLWRFITPGLASSEKRYAIPFVGSALALFALGAFIAFRILPVGIQFLLSFTEPAEPLIQLPEYLSFVILMVLAFGLSFEFPLVLVFLALAGLLTSRTLAGRRRLAVLMAFIIAAVATPGGDPLSQTAMAVPLYILYEASILVIRFVLKR